jgi:alkylation response protein AidB-like acyl-CoA dehydrogenase
VAQSAAERSITPMLASLRTAAYRATDAGLQVLGGTGYVAGAGAERIWRDVRQLGPLLAPGE